MDSMIETSLRTVIGFCILLVITRLLGKKQLGQLTYFTYITGIALGNIAGDMVVHKDISLGDGITGLCVWAILTFSVEYVSLKNSKFRVAFDGEPTIVIKNGKIMQSQLAIHRLNIDDLSMMLRVNNIFSISDVDYAILEPNGELSILKKSHLEEITRQDLNINPTPRYYLPSELVSDGRLIERNLKELGLTNEWLIGELKNLGYNSFEQIFYAEIQSDGTVIAEGKQDMGETY